MKPHPLLGKRNQPTPRDIEAYEKYRDWMKQAHPTLRIADLNTWRQTTASITDILRRETGGIQV